MLCYIMKWVSSIRSVRMERRKKKYYIMIHAEIRISSSNFSLFYIYHSKLQKHH